MSGLDHPKPGEYAMVRFHTVSRSQDHCAGLSEWRALVSSAQSIPVIAPDGNGRGVA